MQCMKETNIKLRWIKRYNYRI